MEHALECMVAIGIKAPRDLGARREPNEDSPQQATGYQKENRLLMRNHGFSNSSL
jgi:hypothetical protein